VRIRSHLDPTLFVVFLHIDARSYDEEFRALARSLETGPGTNISPLFNGLKDREHRIVAHERYHFWQGLRLPFLHIYALMTLRNSVLGARELAKAEPDWRRWPKLDPITTGFDRLDMAFHLSGDRSGQLAFARQGLPPAEYNLSSNIKDMLECAASIFDYQASCTTSFSEMSDPICFASWRKLRPRYLKVYDFLSSFFQSEQLALRSALPLINAAFRTSNPEVALALLAGKIWHLLVGHNKRDHPFLAQPEPVRWPDLFRSLLEDLPYDLPYGETPETIDFSEPAFYYLDPERWLGLSLGGGLQHPLLGPLAHEWLRRAKHVPGLEDYLDLPGYIINEEAHQFAASAEPQLRVVRVFLEDGSDKTFAVGEGLVGPAFIDNSFRTHSASEFRGFLLDMMAVYGAFRRSCEVHMTETTRTCGHIACPHYEDNLCNAYPLIPNSYAQCGFPSRLSKWIASQQ
jgi:hypothetical protein